VEEEALEEVRLARICKDYQPRDSFLNANTAKVLITLKIAVFGIT
jgi:hypothetical protein